MEVEWADRQAQFKGKRGQHRKAYARQLDFLAALDNPNRSIPPSERAISV